MLLICRTASLHLSTHFILSFLSKASTFFPPLPTMVKLLCLPGYLQSGKAFAEKSSGLRKILTKKLNYELDYIDPPTLIGTKEELPFVLSADEAEANEKWNQIVENNLNRCWWIHTDDGQYKGFQLAVDYVVNIVKEKGPYDGIIGFSQGAAMSAVMANIIGNLLPEHGSFKAAILFSSFAFTVPVNSEDTMNDINSEVKELDEYSKKVILAPGFEGYFAPPQQFPTTVASIFGSEDMVVPPIRSEYLTEQYPELCVVKFQHDGGHYLPNKKVFLNPIVDTIKSAVEQKASL